MRKRDFYICENKTQISFAVTARLISAFVFAICIVPLLPNSEISSLKPSSVALQPGLCRTWSKTPKTDFLTTRLIYYYTNVLPPIPMSMLFEPRYEKPGFCICENKDADQLRGISAFVFATRIVQSLFFLNLKFQASSHLLWLYSPGCAGPGQKTRKPVFSQRGSFLVGYDAFSVHCIQ